MQSSESSVEAYLKSLPESRRREIHKLRELILAHLPKGYEEGMQYGMIGYFVPLSVYPTTYNGKPLGYIAVASQKNYISLYLMGIYGEGEQEFRSEYKKSGKKLNMGKSCVRFNKFDDLPKELIAKIVAAQTPKEFIAQYEAARG